MLDGIKNKLEREFKFQINTGRDPIKMSSADQLIFQRILGHKDELQGSGQWYESSERSVGYKPHPKNTCWMCENHVYTVIFWSRSFAFKMTPILNKEQTEVVRFEIDRDFGEQDQEDLFYCNPNVKYSQMENQTPYICGSFTGWRYRKMYKLEEFTRNLEGESTSPFELAAAAGKIKKKTTSVEMCNDYEKSWVDYYAVQEKLRFTYDWRHFFKKYLRFKRPFIANGHFFYDKPSHDGVVPQELKEDDWF